jgi:hypothetical protein
MHTFLILGPVPVVSVPYRILSTLPLPYIFAKVLFKFIFAYMYLSFLRKILTLIFLEELANF